MTIYHMNSIPPIILPPITQTQIVSAPRYLVTKGRGGQQQGNGKSLRHSSLHSLLIISIVRAPAAAAAVMTR